MQTLKKAYPNCHLPVDKTIKRVLNGETTHPRETLLGFLAAYILDKTEEEVSEADKKNKLGDFYKMYAAQIEQKKALTQPLSVPQEYSESGANSKLKGASSRNEETKSKLLWTLWIAVLILVFYILYVKKISNQSFGFQLPAMVAIKGGAFTMGDTFNDTDNTTDEKPFHKVIIDSFEMSATEITFDLFDKYCVARHIPLRDDLGWGRGSRPAIMMDWYDAIDFCNWLSELKNLKPVYTIQNMVSNSTIKVISNLDNNGYRLPTEAEWEYAASLDLSSNTKYRFGHHQNIADGKELNFNFKSNSEKGCVLVGDTFHNQTVPVLESGKNLNGLYGMAGNVAEWCHDYYHPHFYSDNQNGFNPTAEAFVKDSSRLHVLRGGTWEESYSKIRATARQASPANSRTGAIGFRVVKRSAQKQEPMVFTNTQLN